MTQYDDDAPRSTPPPEGSSNSAVKVIVGIVVLLCIAAAGLLFLQHKKVAGRRTHRGATPTFRPEGPTASLDLGGGVNVKLVRVPAGSFMMGSDDTDPNADVSEMDGNGKKHKVTIRHPLYVGQTEITRAQYKAVMGYDPSAFKEASKYPADVASNMQLPADQVAWGDAHKWCAEVQKRTGAAVRLPTEAEWEYACRAGTQTPYSCGTTLTPDVAQFDTGTGGAATQGAQPKTTAPVGTHQPNAFGLYDMHGNVSEWVEDNYHDDYSGAPADGSAWKSAEKPYLHVHRGGSYNNTAPTCRSAMREAGGSDTDPELRTSTIGFRVVITGPAAAAAPKATVGAEGRRHGRHAATAATRPSTAPAQ